MIKKLLRPFIRLRLLALFLICFLSFFGIPKMKAQTIFCQSDSLTLNLTAYVGSVQWESSVNGSSWVPIVGETGSSFITFVTAETWYRAQILFGTCNPLYSDTTHILVSNLVVDAGPDQVIPLGTPVALGGAPTASGGIAPYSYSWTPGATLNSSIVANPTATPIDTTTYFLMVTDFGGCMGMDTGTVFTTVTIPSSGQDTFYYTGVNQTFTVPAGVTSITIECLGAAGGNSTNNSYAGGKGVLAIGTFTSIPAQVLNVVVGKMGNPDPYSSGGGGGSGVGLGATPWIVAGGGAGVDFQQPFFSGLDATVGTAGISGQGPGGLGGAGGADGGDNIYSGVNISRGGRGWNAGNSGSTGLDGVSSNTTWTAGTFGLGGGGGSVGAGYCNCGGGGGGYSGGGSGNINNSGGGGGSYNVGTAQTMTAGANTADGRVIISW